MTESTPYDLHDDLHNNTLWDHMSVELVDRTLGPPQERLVPASFWDAFTQQAVNDAGSPLFTAWIQRVHPGHPQGSIDIPHVRILRHVFETIANCDLGNIELLNQPSNPLWEVVKKLSNQSDIFSHQGTWSQWCEARNQAQHPEQQALLDALLNIMLMQPYSKTPRFSQRNSQHFLLALGQVFDAPNIDPERIEEGLKYVDFYHGFWRHQREMYQLIDTLTPEQSANLLPWIVQAHQSTGRTFYEAFPSITKIFCAAPYSARWNEQFNILNDVCGWAHAAESAYGFLYPQIKRSRSMDDTHQLTDSHLMARKSWDILQGHWRNINRSHDHKQWLTWAAALDDIDMLGMMVERNTHATSMIDDDNIAAFRWAKFFQMRPNSGMKSFIPFMRAMRGARLAPQEEVDELLRITDMQAGKDDVLALMVAKSIRQGDDQAMQFAATRTWTDPAVMSNMTEYWGKSWAHLVERAIVKGEFLIEARNIWNTMGQMKYGQHMRQGMLRYAMAHIFLQSVPTTTFTQKGWERNEQTKFDFHTNDDDLNVVMNALSAIVGQELQNWSWDSSILKSFQQQVAGENVTDIIQQFTSRIQSYILTHHTSSLADAHDHRRPRKI